MRFVVDMVTVSVPATLATTCIVAISAMTAESSIVAIVAAAGSGLTFACLREMKRMRDAEA